MESTLLHQINPDRLRQLIREEIQDQLKPPPEDKPIPKNVAAKRLKRSLQTLDAWHRAGILKKKYIGGRVFYMESDVRRFETK